jgi:hypothetical protein
VPHDVNGAPDGHGRFFSRHPAEVVHLDDLRQRWFFSLERLERVCSSSTFGCPAPPSP